MMFAALFGGIIIGYVLALLRYNRILTIVPELLSHYIMFMKNYNAQQATDKTGNAMRNQTIKR